MQHFTHLHLHSEYSLLDGAISLDKLIRFGKEHDLRALAITDHGNIFGAVKFFEKCKKAGIKPILGIEAYFTEDVNIKAVHKKYYHLIVLVQNAIGYKNLCKLIAYSYQQGFYFKPRIDYSILQQYNEGLIVTSACLGGHIPTLLMQENLVEADQRIDWFLDVFGRDRFFLEVQPEDQKEQSILNHKLYELSATKNIQLVATGDCHYVSAADREAHEVMLAIQTQHKLTDQDRFTFGDCRVHMRTTQEMLDIFHDHEQAVWNTGLIADMCEFAFDTGKLFFPKFTIPQSHTPETFFKEQCYEGLEKLCATKRIKEQYRLVYTDRLNLEIELIIGMGFVGYFLVVSDFIKWAKKNGIPVGPGRGSAAGSLVAWALEITNIDPIEYNLLFERFLNPERITMPDIDIDFCIEGRDKVINYVRDLYGHDKVGQIITFGTMMAKGVVKDVARVLGISFEDSNYISGLIPDQLKITLAEAFEQEPRLKELMEQNPAVAKLFDLALRLEGLTRHASKHAAGIVISPEPIQDVLPVYIPPKSTELVTQYAMTELEALGFLKIDFLGLKNLTLIDRVIKSIFKEYHVYIDIDMLPLDDAKTFNLMSRGKTAGVFQLESDGLQELLRKLQPDTFEDIIAVNALYRPGPLGSGMADDFVERRHGRQKIVYLFPELEPVLKDTYGVIVYQEQVMKIASVIAGFSLGEADILRRAMGKKKPEEMAKQRSLFHDKSVARGFDGKKADELFDLMAYFAGYGFNKSHAAAYSLITYQTAYLKAHYVAHFMAALISLEATHPENMVLYLQEAKDLGIEIIPPNINASDIYFKAQGNTILFGLQGIKNVGFAALENIISEREKRPFFDLLDFCKRIDLRTSNKRVIESLICAGAFDTLPGTRSQKCEELSKIMDLATEQKKAAQTGQMGLFHVSISQEGPSSSYTYAPLPEWDSKLKLEKEREVIGFFLSSHPLDHYAHYLRWLRIPSFGKLYTEQSEQNVMGCGLLKTKKVITTKKGERMAFLMLEDKDSKTEVVIFPKLYAKIEALLDQHQIFIVKGEIDTAPTQFCKIKAHDFIPLENFFQELKTNLQIQLILPPVIPERALHDFRTKSLKGNNPVYCILQENNKRVLLKTQLKVSVNTVHLQELESQSIGVRILV